MTAPAPALPAVHFRPIRSANLNDCLSLELGDHQRRFVADPARSLAQAYVNPALRPYGVYERASVGFEVPVTPLVGLVVLEVAGGSARIGAPPAPRPRRADGRHQPPAGKTG